MSGALRWWIWGALAVGAAAALWFAPPPQPPQAPQTPRTPPTADGPPGRPDAAPAPVATVPRGSALDPPPLRLPPPPAPAEPDDARRFAAMWQLGVVPPAPAASTTAPRAPASPAPAAAAAAPPVALNWPYRLLGRWRDGARDAVILQGPDGQVAIASQGDTLPGDWHIDTVVANTLVYSHGPSGQRQTLDLGFAR